MVYFARKVVLLVLIGSIACSQIGCDKLTDFFSNFSGQQKKVETQPPETSYEKTQLLSIVDNQKELLEQLENERALGDKRSIKNTYEEFLRLDQDYQDKYAKYEEKLSSSDCMEISKKHYEIMRSLPQISSLME